MILKRIFQRPQPPERSVYEAIVAAARHPALYTEMTVADTVDGRYDMVALHTFLVLDRLKGTEPVFRQSLVDEFFRDMDRSLREMGASDVGVGKKVRKMAEVFYGRVAAYDRALEKGQNELEAALNRNVFPESPNAVAAAKLAAYMLNERRHLAGQAATAIAGGNVNFEEPAR